MVIDYLHLFTDRSVAFWPRRRQRHPALRPPAVRGALTRAFAGGRTPDATYRQENIFRYLLARV